MYKWMGTMMEFPVRNSGVGDNLSTRLQITITLIGLEVLVF